MRGKVLKLNLLLGTFIILVISALFLFPGSAVTSSGGNITVTPDSVSLNWSMIDINITSNNDSVILWVNNATNVIEPMYFDSSKYGSGDYDDYDSGRIYACFTNGMEFAVQNSSGSYTNMTGLLNNTNSTIYNITAFQFCPPGYYFGLFNVSQNGTNDYANITMTLNIPVSSENTFNETLSYSFVKGNMSANSNLIHKYYFNTSQAENTTGVSVNLTWGDYNEEIDIYLFDSSGNLLERSVENKSSEVICRELPSTPDMWEMWIYGNVSSLQNYVASMYFTTLNVTNTSDQTQEITSIDFGNLDPENNESGQFNLTISNVDATSRAGIVEKSEIYRVDTWNDKNQTVDYYFLVPDFAHKIKVKMEWTGGTRWFISLNDSNGVFRGNSSEKYETGNKTDSVQEESIVYEGTIDTDNDGLWKLTVGNISAISDDKHNITVYVWYNTSFWLSSDYPASGFDFNTTGSENSSKNVSLQITLPSVNMTNGTFEGFIDYYKPSEWMKRIPISFQVMAGTLLVNEKLYSVTEVRNDTRGFNRLGANVVTVNITINNTGGRDVYFVNTSSNNTLFKDSYYMNFTYDEPSSPIPAGSSEQITVNITINTSNTGDSSGIYTGWIRLNTTNSSNSSSVSYPFEVFHITINVNLTDYLMVNVTNIVPTYISQVENNSNLTVNLSVQINNQTMDYVSTNTIVDQSDFYSVHLSHANVTYTTSTTFQNLTSSDTGGTWGDVCPAEYTYCLLNGTLLSGKPGGPYYALASVRLNTSRMGGTGINITGTGQSSVLTVINNVGLELIPKDVVLINNGNPLDETDTDYWTIYVNNYGPLQADNAEIIFNKGSCEVSVTPTLINTSCDFGPNPTSSGTTWNVTIPGYVAENNCSLTWEVTANSVDLDQSWCYMTVGVATSHGSFGNLTGVGVEVHDNSSAGGAPPGGDSPPPADADCDDDSDCSDTQVCSSGTCSAISCSGGYVKDHKCYTYETEYSIANYEEIVYIMQGSVNSTKVTVKNNGGYTRTTKLNASIDLEGVTVDVIPSSYSLASGNSGVFTVNFSVTDTTEVGYHKVTLKAYVSSNESIKKTQDIKLGVQPTEETKAAINKTLDDLKILFEQLTASFNQLTPSDDANYTIANRTYNRLVSMFRDIEESITLENYLEANTLLKDANTSITEFQEQIVSVTGGMIGLPFGGDMMTWVAILVVIVVIGGFMIYLLLPPKKGYHKSLGYVPKEKISIVNRLKHIFSGLKKVKSVSKIKGKQEEQMTLEEFEEHMKSDQKPQQPPPSTPPEKKTYAQGYERTEDFGLAYKKDEMKKKRRLQGK